MKEKKREQDKLINELLKIKVCYQTYPLEEKHTSKQQSTIHIYNVL